MIIRFTASSIVAMILFIPLLIAMGLILAFIVPLLAVMVAAVGIVFLGVYTFARIGLVKKQRDLFTEKPKSAQVGSSRLCNPAEAGFAAADWAQSPGRRLGGQSKTTGKIGGRGKSTVEVKDYKVR
ncbi:hypothetical protein HYU20_02060 [Candidatus Woesearchaeota archaeon]|nr:hypothetical protein [Candidatus Woesearchaeota archaeon]